VKAKGVFFFNFIILYSAVLGHDSFKYSPCGGVLDTDFGVVILDVWVV